MKDINEIIETEERYKKLLMIALKDDKRISVTGSSSKYPEPAFAYVKSVATDKIIAVRFDGGDNTMRFWDYIDDDDYSSEAGVWDRMTDAGLERFVKKLYGVMDKAIDIEYYDIACECNDYYSGVASYELTAENARAAVKKYGKDSDFVFAKFINFYGDVQFVFDRSFKQVIKK